MSSAQLTQRVRRVDVVSFPCVVGSWSTTTQPAHGRTRSHLACPTCIGATTVEALACGAACASGGGSTAGEAGTWHPYRVGASASGGVCCHYLLGLGVTFGLLDLDVGLVVFGLFVVGHVGHQHSRVDRSGTVGIAGSCITNRL